MKLKNKILIVLLILALSICLALASSASGVYVNTCGLNNMLVDTFYGSLSECMLYTYVYDVDGELYYNYFVDDIYGFLIDISSNVDIKNQENLFDFFEGSYSSSNSDVCDIGLDEGNRSFYLWSSINDLYSEIFEAGQSSAPGYDEGYDDGYEDGYYDGYDVGDDGVEDMYNSFIDNINTAFKTDYPHSDGKTFDLTVPSQAYTIAYEAGELYQLNKLTDDGGISDFLADISGTILSTFFYLGSNISFMGTTALSLISLFVIAAIVIFILKFVIKG